MNRNGLIDAFILHWLTKLCEASGDKEALIDVMYTKKELTISFMTNARGRSVIIERVLPMEDFSKTAESDEAIIGRAMAELFEEWKQS